MAEFLKDSQVMTSIEELIEKSDSFLWLISPYIKLHDRIKDKLKAKKTNPKLEIVIVFGKNEDDTSKSLSKEDFEFLKSFPNITIGYEKRLHAKYYASEDFSIITSMNLHEFSQNNNIEIAIRLKNRNWLQAQIASEDLAHESMEYFDEVVDNCSIVFQNEPKFKAGLLGITSSYTHSEVVIDESESFFLKKENFQGKKYKQSRHLEKSEANQTSGYCIRTGKLIPFNPAKPMCKEAYDSWSKYKNPDYPEKYCHKTGKPSQGKTTMKNPVL